jgi:ribosomal protein S27AE
VNTCPLCRGAQNLIAFHDGRPWLFECCSCGGAGVLAQHGPAEIRIHKFKLKKAKA